MSCPATSRPSLLPSPTLALCPSLALTSSHSHPLVLAQWPLTVPLTLPFSSTPRPTPTPHAMSFSPPTILFPPVCVLSPSPLRLCSNCSCNMGFLVHSLQTKSQPSTSHTPASLHSSALFYSPPSHLSVPATRYALIHTCARMHACTHAYLCRLSHSPLRHGGQPLLPSLLIGPLVLIRTGSAMLLTIGFVIVSSLVSSVCVGSMAVFLLKMLRLLPHLDQKLFYLLLMFTIALTKPRRLKSHGEMEFY